jgi:hypothetical protein
LCDVVFAGVVSDVVVVLFLVSVVVIVVVATVVDVSLDVGASPVLVQTVLVSVCRLFESVLLAFVVAVCVVVGSVVVLCRCF